DLNSTPERSGTLEMATTKKLAELFRAIAASDARGAAVIAAQICSLEEKKGHRLAARLLRGALHANGSASRKHEHSANGNISSGANVISTALTRLSSEVNLSEVVLSPMARIELEGM